MVELLLFLGMICLLFFMPVYFDISYQKVALDDQMVLEMRFLYGLLKRRKEVSFFKPIPFTPQKEVRTSGRWFFWKQSERKVSSSLADSFGGDRSFWYRLQHFGLGITLLSYFLPANYQSWLLVVEELEHKGHFQKFHGSLRVGTGDPAATAQLYGLLWAAAALAVNYLQRLAPFDNPPELEIKANFQKASLDMIFHCIFRIKLGHIIIAAIWARLRYRFLKGGASL